LIRVTFFEDFDDNGGQLIRDTAPIALTQL